MKQNHHTMAWNEPGSGKNNQNQSENQNQNQNKNQNPWNRGRKEQGPPDLDQIIKKLLDKLKESFIGKNRGKKFTFGSSGSGNSSNSHSNGNSGSGNPGNRGGKGGFGGGNFGKALFGDSLEWSYLATIAVIVFGFIYLISGIYIVEPPERAVIMRFGRYLSTKGPGPHWLPTFIDSKVIVNVEQVHTSDHSGLMLTKDRNIANVGVAVQYRISDEAHDVRAYLFNVINPIHSLQESAESALRQVVGQYTMDEVLTLKRSEIAQAIKVQLIDTLRTYQTGIQVLDVAMQFAKAPDEVRTAFDDVIKAAADEERLVNQARAYENEVLPKARATVERLKNEALGYKEEITLLAEGNVQRFNRILPEYKKAPKVTQTRLYLDAMEDLLRKSTKIIVESNGNNNMVYLPLDKLIHSHPNSNSNLNPEMSNSNTGSQNSNSSSGFSSSSSNSSSSYPSGLSSGYTGATSVTNSAASLDSNPPPQTGSSRYNSKEKNL